MHHRTTCDQSLLNPSQLIHGADQRPFASEVNAAVFPRPYVHEASSGGRFPSARRVISMRAPFFRAASTYPFTGGIPRSLSPLSSGESALGSGSRSFSTLCFFFLFF